MNKLAATVFVFAFLVFNPLCVWAIDDIENSGIPPAEKTEYGNIQYTAKEFKKSLFSVAEKFVNLNIRSAYDDLSKMIMDNESSDYYLILLADKASELGFFDLSDLAFSKITDCDIAAYDSGSSHKLFFPKCNLSRSEILVLAEALSNIRFNDRSSDAVRDITEKITNLDENDYANYLLASGYLKLNEIDNAKKHIQTALSLNPDNLNYKILQSQITANTKKNKKALKSVSETKKINLGYYPIKNRIEVNEQYVKYKTEKQSWLKDYHLGYYYFLKDDTGKALKILQGAISRNNSHNALLYSLMGRIYVKNGEYDKAETVATKAYGYNISNVDTLLSLGDIAYENNKYKQALKYYKQAAKSRSAATEAKLKLADTYSKLNNSKTSKSIYKKAAKEDSTAYEAYYHIALGDPAVELNYLKKSVAINPNFKDGWIDLSRVMIEKGNLALAKKYLENAYYLDENDFRYYYYQSLLIKKTEELNKYGKNKY